ncbi:hypothetical protein [Nonomuraea longicatena]|uniref:HTH marR-type domain-containing protein n=1 Tax=Nonomuraea longicatena TaxID=83682 RepID=A0ABN1QA28_9ACTN
MVRLLDRLQATGRFTRTRNPANRRTHLLSLTDAGRTALHDRDTLLTKILHTPPKPPSRPDKG